MKVDNQFRAPNRICSLFGRPSCVQGKKDGLRDGDECIEESSEYKKCRQKAKSAKSGEGSKSIPTPAANEQSPLR